jgi:hypothetical protein
MEKLIDFGLKFVFGHSDLFRTADSMSGTRRNNILADALFRIRIAGGRLPRGRGARCRRGICCRPGDAAWGHDVRAFWLGGVNVLASKQTSAIVAIG